MDDGENRSQPREPTAMGPGAARRPGEQWSKGHTSQLRPFLARRKELANSWSLWGCQHGRRVCAAEFCSFAKLGVSLVFPSQVSQRQSTVVVCGAIVWRRLFCSREVSLSFDVIFGPERQHTQAGERPPMCWITLQCLVEQDLCLRVLMSIQFNLSYLVVRLGLNRLKLNRAFKLRAGIVGSLLH